MTKNLILTPVLLLLVGWHSVAQQVATGSLTDIETGMVIEGASIINLTSGAGTLSLDDGSFTIQLVEGKNTLEISHLAYEDILIAIPRHRPEAHKLGTISLTSKVIGLEEISIISALATDRRTPVAASTLPAQLIERNMGNKNYPEIMKRVPGVYATQTGGGTGDARLSIRGFQQENVALLLNGIPVSSFENGLVHWSNWAGLADATQTIQVQRGLGASKVATNSVGGTINIITRPAKATRGGSIRYTMSDFGNSRIIVNLSSGLMENGFAVQFLGSRTTGPGYADALHVDAWSYYLALSRQLNQDHKLVFTALGSPERHGQRSHGLTNEQFTNLGNRYNPNWGFFNGRINSVNENFYHKPHISLNHYWNVNETSTLMTAAYFSAGAGGGKFTQSFGNYPSTFSIRRNNQIDWDTIFLNNSTHNHTYTLDDGTVKRGFSKNIQTNYLATHYWVGLLSQWDRTINNNFNITTGFHSRHFKSRLRQEISDLLGGQFWIEDYSRAIEGRGNRSQIKRKGDITGVDNGASIQYMSAFSQLDYTTANWNIFAQATVSRTWYRREDRFNYLTNIQSQLVSQSGFDIKAGANYNINRNHHLFFNTGFNSREPYYKFVFVNFSNAVARDLRNERVAAIEAGYGYHSALFSLRFNGYYTLWQDRSLLSHENIQLIDGSQTRALVRGLDALHRGVELEATVRPTRNLTMLAIASVGDWRWRNDVVAELYNDLQQPVGTTEVYAKGLKVGDAPQTQLGFFSEYNFWDNFNLSVEYTFFSRLYANFDPTGRNDPNNRAQPFRIPDYHMIDMHLGYNFSIAGLRAYAQITGHNLKGIETILRGEDGHTHDLNSFRGFWSFGRTFNFSLRVAF